MDNALDFCHLSLLSIYCSTTYWKMQLKIIKKRHQLTLVKHGLWSSQQDRYFLQDPASMIKAYNILKTHLWSCTQCRQWQEKIFEKCFSGSCFLMSFVAMSKVLKEILSLAYFSFAYSTMFGLRSTPTLWNSETNVRYVSIFGWKSMLDFQNILMKKKSRKIL